MINEHDCIVLTQDVPDDGLEAGDVGEGTTLKTRQEVA
jgi:hypothetical protein